MTIRIDTHWIRARRLEGKKLLTGHEAAAYLGVSYPNFRNMAKRHDIPFVQGGSRRFYSVLALDRLLDRGGTPPPGEQRS